MPRRVVSLLHRGPAALRASDPVLEANAYALAVDVDLTVVLRGEGVELAIADGKPGPRELAGAALPASAGGHDLQGLLESGVPVYVDESAAARRGLTMPALLDGVRIADSHTLDALVADAEAVIQW